MNRHSILSAAGGLLMAGTCLSQPASAADTGKGGVFIPPPITIPSPGRSGGPAVNIDRNRFNAPVDKGGGSRFDIDKSRLGGGSGSGGSSGSPAKKQITTTPATKPKVAAPTTLPATVKEPAKATETELDFAVREANARFGKVGAVLIDADAIGAHDPLRADSVEVGEGDGAMLVMPIASVLRAYPAIATMPGWEEWHLREIAELVDMSRLSPALTGDGGKDTAALLPELPADGGKSPAGSDGKWPGAADATEKGEGSGFTSQSPLDTLRNPAPGGSGVHIGHLGQVADDDAVPIAPIDHQYEYTASRSFSRTAEGQLRATYYDSLGNPSMIVVTAETFTDAFSGQRGSSKTLAQIYLDVYTGEIAQAIHGDGSPMSTEEAASYRFSVTVPEGEIMVKALKGPSKDGDSKLGEGGTGAQGQTGSGQGGRSGQGGQTASTGTEADGKYAPADAQGQDKKVPDPAKKDQSDTRDTKYDKDTKDQAASADDKGGKDQSDTKDTKETADSADKDAKETADSEGTAQNADSDKTGSGGPCGGRTASCVAGDSGTGQSGDAGRADLRYGGMTRAEYMIRRVQTVNPDPNSSQGDGLSGTGSPWDRGSGTTQLDRVSIPGPGNEQDANAAFGDLDRCGGTNCAFMMKVWAVNPGPNH
ncbi:MAG: hypothetical protein VX871_04180 [Pseudomonadota bacterium]|nr:hypothetical protein [Pseudomonadota bacterium]